MDLGTLSSHFRAHSEDPSEGYGLGLLPRQRACILDFFWTHAEAVDHIFMGWTFCIISCKEVVPHLACWLRFLGDWDQYRSYFFIIMLSQFCFPFTRLCHVVALLGICNHCCLIDIRWSDVQVVIWGFSQRHHDAGTHLAAILFNALRQRAYRAITSHSHATRNSGD